MNFEDFILVAAGVVAGVLVITPDVMAKPLCSVEVMTESGKTKQAFMFMNNMPVKTIPQRSVSRIPKCNPDPQLVETAGEADFDSCMRVTVTYINRDTKRQESQFYYNGATSIDGVTWDREPNPGCPVVK